MRKTITRGYSELVSIKEFIDRLEYLMCNGSVGKETFGSHRYLNQRLYTSDRWKKLRREIILRDNGMDLAHENFPINGNIYIHHINPISINDIIEGAYCVFDPNNLISTSFTTHNMIHYGNCNMNTTNILIRKPNDTCPWKE